MGRHYDFHPFLINGKWYTRKLPKYMPVDIGAFPETKEFLEKLRKRRNRVLPSEFDITIKYKEFVGGKPQGVKLVKREKKKS